MSESRLIVRELLAEDCSVIAQAFAAQGWNKPVAQYQAYLREARLGRRTVLLAELQQDFAGYLTIVWESSYPPFREQGIPEIVDFNVLMRYRRQGIGSALMDQAEARIAARSAFAGIGVGLTEDYGAAQVLYVRRGYIPDGRGAMHHRRPLRYGDQLAVDDGLVLYLTMRLLGADAPASVQEV